MKLMVVLLAVGFGYGAGAAVDAALPRTTCYAVQAVRMTLTGPAVVEVHDGQTLEGALYGAQFSWPAWAASAEDPDVVAVAETAVEVPCP